MNDTRKIEKTEPAGTPLRVYLDGRRKVDLDVGAPAAWQAGLDGAGVTVAVPP